MNVIAEIHRINQAELEKGLVGTSASWHSKYADSAWVYVGNLPNALTEGDTLCILSQYGEIEDINLVRDEATGKSRGFAFVKYEDARSCVLAVDNLTGSKVLGRSLRVDHCEKYRLPKDLLEKEEELANRSGPGHAYQDKELANDFSIQQGQDLFARPQPSSSSRRNTSPIASKEIRKEGKKKRKEDRTQRRREREERRERKEEKKREKRAVSYEIDSGDDGKERNRSKKRNKTEGRHYD